MTVRLASIIDQAGSTLGGFLPRLGGALALLVLGLLLALLVRRVLVRALQALGLDDLAERWGVQRVVARVGLGDSFSQLIGAIVRLALSVVVVFAALSLLGLSSLDSSLNAAILFLPHVVAAAALVLAGIVLGEFVRERVDVLTERLDVPGPLGTLAGLVVVAVFGVTGLAELGVPTSVLLLLVAVTLGGAALTFALSFGLGTRDVARALTSRRYVAGALAVGQDVSVGDVRGRIEEIEAAATVLRTPDGREIRVPNNLFVESVVTVHPSAARPAS